MNTRNRPTVLLVGGGHTHSLVARAWAQEQNLEFNMVMVSPGLLSPYSGMLPGAVAGDYTAEEIHLDLVKLCKSGNFTFHQDEIARVDLNTLQAIGRSGKAYKFDWLSIDIGSVPDFDGVPGAKEFATPVKPVSSFLARLDQLNATGISHTPESIVVVGGGAGGCEVAIALRDRLGKNAPIHLVSRSSHLLGDDSPSAAQKMESEVKASGIQLHLETKVERVLDKSVELSNGKTIQSSLVFWVTNASPPPSLSGFGLPLTPSGFLPIDTHLKVIGTSNVFACGDCATLVEAPFPKAGVYAVRQAPILDANLRQALAGASQRTYQAQPRFLSLMRLSGGRALAKYGRFSAKGRFWWWLKDRIDRSFMAKFQDF